jgi:hypothetical protein
MRHLVVDMVRRGNLILVALEQPALERKAVLVAG